MSVVGAPSARAGVVTTHPSAVRLDRASFKSNGFTVCLPSSL
jgi:hypothetical protein